MTQETLPAEYPPMSADPFGNSWTIDKIIQDTADNHAKTHPPPMPAPAAATTTTTNGVLAPAPVRTSFSEIVRQNASGGKKSLSLKAAMTPLATVSPVAVSAPAAPPGHASLTQSTASKKETKVTEVVPTTEELDIFGDVIVSETPPPSPTEPVKVDKKSKEVASITTSSSSKKEKPPKVSPPPPPPVTTAVTSGEAVSDEDVPEEVTLLRARFQEEADKLLEELEAPPPEEEEEEEEEKEKPKKQKETSSSSSSAAAAEAKRKPSEKKTPAIEKKAKEDEQIRKRKREREKQKIQEHKQTFARDPQRMAPVVDRLEQFAKAVAPLEAEDELIQSQDEAVENNAMDLDDERRQVEEMTNKKKKQQQQQQQTTPSMEVDEVEEAELEAAEAEELEKAEPSPSPPTPDSPVRKRLKSGGDDTDKLKPKPKPKPRPELKKKKAQEEDKNFKVDKKGRKLIKVSSLVEMEPEHPTEAGQKKHGGGRDRDQEADMFYDSDDPETKKDKGFVVGPFAEDEIEEARRKKKSRGQKRKPQKKEEEEEDDDDEAGDSGSSTESNRDSGDEIEDAEEAFGGGGGGGGGGDVDISVVESLRALHRGKTRRDLDDDDDEEAEGDGRKKPRKRGGSKKKTEREKDEDGFTLTETSLFGSFKVNPDAELGEGEEQVSVGKMGRQQVVFLQMGTIVPVEFYEPTAAEVENLAQGLQPKDVCVAIKLTSDYKVLLNNNGEPVYSFALRMSEDPTVAVATKFYPRFTKTMARAIYLKCYFETDPKEGKPDLDRPLLKKITELCRSRNRREIKTSIFCGVCPIVPADMLKDLRDAGSKTASGAPPKPKPKKKKKTIDMVPEPTSSEKVEKASATKLKSTTVAITDSHNQIAQKENEKKAASTPNADPIPIPIDSDEENVPLKQKRPIKKASATTTTSGTTSSGVAAAAIIAAPPPHPPTPPPKAPATPVVVQANHTETHSRATPQMELDAALKQLNELENSHQMTPEAKEVIKNVGEVHEIMNRKLPVTQWSRIAQSIHTMHTNFVTLAKTLTEADEKGQFVNKPLVMNVSSYLMMMTPHGLGILRDQMMKHLKPKDPATPAITLVASTPTLTPKSSVAASSSSSSSSSSVVSKPGAARVVVPAKVSKVKVITK